MTDQKILSPAGKMAQVLREKSQKEWEKHPCYKDPRVQSTEWGPMEENFEQWCPECNGSGWGDSAALNVCRRCEGTGSDINIEILSDLFEAYQKSVSAEDWDVDVTRRVTALLGKHGAL